MFEWMFGWTDDPDKTAERAYALAHDALALDPASPTLNWTMAVAHLHLRQDHGAAEAAYKRAMTLDPNSPDIVADWGGDLGYFGRGDEGIEAVRNAMALNPTHPAWYEWCLATPAFTARRYDDVVTALEGADEPSRPRRCSWRPAWPIWEGSTRPTS